MSKSTPTEFLFSYGTLQDKDVQVANFGRELTGREDALSGYTRKLVGDYLNAERSSDPKDAVPGVVFEVTPEELEAADRYEEDAEYRRIAVTLRSGVQAWVYVRGGAAGSVPPE